MAGIAEKTGLAYDTVRFYHNKAEARRREKAPKPGDFPPPDDTFGRSPVWREGTIDIWLANRPGRGAGGGRPRKHPEE
ncbi:hypothetical protein ADL21_11205 [Streptomyces albus subsp. albus]|nr:hypothetical protein ADL21_11205 [Streptomyces albus subsp. albus]